MTRRLALIALTTALVLAATSGTALAHHYDYLLAPSSKCANQTNTSLSTSDQELVMRCLHNYARVHAGRAPLRASSLLQTSSDRKTGDLMSCGFSHTACGRPFDYWIRRAGYVSSSCSSWGLGENIAWGTGSLGTPRAIMSGWLHSDGHRHNLLSSSFRDVGFGLRKGTIDGYRGASVWTAQFGYRSGC
jgi:uncharacterized protein YkwD